MVESNRNHHTTTNVEDRQIEINRVFDAPRELVFKAWIDPKQLAKM